MSLPFTGQYGRGCRSRRGSLRRSGRTFIASFPADDEGGAVTLLDQLADDQLGSFGGCLWTGKDLIRQGETKLKRGLVLGGGGGRGCRDRSGFGGRPRQGCPRQRETGFKPCEGWQGRFRRRRCSDCLQGLLICFRGLVGSLSGQGQASRPGRWSRGVRGGLGPLGKGGGSPRPQRWGQAFQRGGGCL